MAEFHREPEENSLQPLCQKAHPQTAREAEAEEGIQTYIAADSKELTGVIPVAHIPVGIQGKTDDKLCQRAQHTGQKKDGKRLFAQG